MAVADRSAVGVTVAITDTGAGVVGVVRGAVTGRSSVVALRSSVVTVWWSLGDVISPL